MDIYYIAVIVFLGILLIMVELFLLVGSVKFGVLGALVMVCGIVLAYTYLGVQMGSLILFTSLLTTLLLVAIAFRLMKSKKVGLQEVVTGKVNEVDGNLIAIGSTGVAFGDLKLVGKAQFANEVFEVESTGDYIDDGSNIVVVKVLGSKILVEKMIN